jgi:hypothetical protein
LCEGQARDERTDLVDEQPEFGYARDCVVGVSDVGDAGARRGRDGFDAEAVRAGKDGVSTPEGKMIDTLKVERVWVRRKIRRGQELGYRNKV